MEALVMWHLKGSINIVNWIIFPSHLSCVYVLCCELIVCATMPFYLICKKIIEKKRKKLF